MMKKTLAAVACFFLVVSLAGAQNRARQVNIKMASMVPENTAWGAALNKMAAEWSRATNGEVKLTVYHNGVQGDESAVLQKLRMNTIQAGLLTSFGLNKITHESLTVSCPFLIRTDDEFIEVMKTVKPESEARINSGNYYSLALIRGGWIKFFSRSPVFVPADLKKQKVGSFPSEPELAQAFRAMGYQVVMVNQTELLVKLNGGAIDAVYQSPIASAGFQYFGVAKNMTSFNIAPFMGGMILNKQAWNSIPEKYRAELQQITQRIGVEIEMSLAKLENDATAAMLKNGLVINNISPQQAQAWYDDMNRALPNLLDSTFDRVTYTKIETILKNYRGRQ
jgi:TRAP-type C4-dicarboxylate transport system substrate-binding protein